MSDESLTPQEVAAVIRMTTPDPTREVQSHSPAPPCSGAASNVVAMSPEGITVKEERHDRCWHGKDMIWRGLTLDVELRTVECSHCGAVLDPFDALYALYRKLTNEREWKQQTQKLQNSDYPTESR